MKLCIIQFYSTGLLWQVVFVRAEFDDITNPPLSVGLKGWMC